MVLCEGGDAWCWGHNRTGQLAPAGLPLGASAMLPVRLHLQKPGGAPLAIEQLALGAAHVLVLDSDGHVYSWGGNGCGQCGVEVYSHVVRPLRVHFGTDARITRVSCGRYHSAAISAKGQVFTWGSNNRGQLGQDSQRCDVYEPILVEEFWFNNSSTSGQKNWQSNQDFEIVSAVDIVCGQDHTLVVSDEGRVYAAGYNWHRSLQVDPADPVVSWFNRVDKLPYRAKSIIAVKNGRLSVAVTDNGIYTWGLRKGCSVLSCHLATSTGAAWSWSWSGIPGNQLAQVFGDQPSPCFKLASALHMEHSPNLSSVYINVPLFYNNSHLSDVVLNVRGEKLACHSFILRLRCPHFGNLIFEDSSSVELRRMAVRVVTVDQYDTNVYTCFIRYLYTGILEQLNGHQLIELWSIAKDYSVEDLKCSTVRLFSDSLNLENYKLLFNLVIEKKTYELEDVIIRYLDSEERLTVMRRSRELENIFICEQDSTDGVCDDDDERGEDEEKQHDMPMSLIQLVEECEETTIEGSSFKGSGWKINGSDREVCLTSDSEDSQDDWEIHQAALFLYNGQHQLQECDVHDDDDKSNRIMRTSL